MNRIHLIISGDVQGVGFRAWITRKAQDNNLTGWVKNRADGAVEIVVEGDKKILNKFIDDCRQGPDTAWVEQADIKWLTATGEYVGFEVIYL
jgi:acylphosphatase